MVVVIMGVTGSGKTTIGNQLAAKLDWRYYDADDFHPPANIEKMSNGIPLDDGDRLPWLETLRTLIHETLHRNENCVLACSALKQRYRDYLLIDEQVKLIYLKGDYDLIQTRLNQREGHYMAPNLLASQFDILEEPKCDAQVEIASNPDEIVREIIERLHLTPLIAADVRSSGAPD
jgi:gluconokinase